MQRGVIAAGLVLAFGSAARADDNDLVLGRLTERMTVGTGEIIVPQNAALRALASQLGVVLAPSLMTPADTLGFGGVQMSLEYATTTIDASGAYWRAREADPGDGSSTAPGSLTTVGFFARKGFWFPVPSFEIGGGATHLVDSRIWTGQIYGKFAVVEGFHGLPLPSVAVRGAVSRMMQQRELDLTIASLDIVVSKHVGVGGTWRFDPFAGWNLLMIVPRSEVIDPTPNIDPLVPGNEPDADQSFVFREQDTIFRHRLFLGAKAQYSVVQLTLQATWALAGTSVDDQPMTSARCTMQDTTTLCDAEDASPGQRTVTLSAGIDF